MYLANANSSEIVKRQYFFKLRAFIGSFVALMFVQWMALGLTILSGSGMMATSSGDLSIKVTYFDGNSLIMFTLMWAFVTGITLTTKQTRYGDFAFVTNRFTSNLSNIAFLLTASLIAGVTSMMASNLVRVIKIFFSNTDIFLQYSSSITIFELTIGILATTLYTILIAAIGYFIGMLVQLSKLFIIIFAGLFIALPIIFGVTMENVLFFFNKETSLFIFTIKVVITSLVLFAGAILISNRMEVRR